MASKARIALLLLLAVPVAACGGGDDTTGVEEQAGRDGGEVSDGGDGCLLSTNRQGCRPDEVCDESQTPGTCVSKCNGGKGCLSWSVATAAGPATGSPIETCNPATSKCEPLTCAGAACQPGQVCLVTDASSPHALEEDPSGACSCHPEMDIARTGARYGDSCAPLGLVCDAKRDPATDAAQPPWSCRKPKATEPCQKTVGCAEASLECVALSGGSRCLKKCAASTECPADEFCAPAGTSAANHCFPNYCGDDAQGRLDAALFFKPCNATDPLVVSGTTLTPKAGTDGTCLPREDDAGLYGVCIAGGTAPAGGACVATRERAPAASRCRVGEDCDPVAPDTADPTKVRGQCHAACNAAPVSLSRKPNVSCAAAGDLCAQVSTSTSAVARSGLCFPGCNALTGSPACSGQDVLGDALGCALELRENGAGACRGLRANAGAAGAPCAPRAASDERLRCQSGLTCDDKGTRDAADDVCTGLCDATACTDPRAACSACSGALACRQFTAELRENVGYCGAALP